MITRDNYAEEHIRELQAASKGDPGLIERTLYAFGLLEALRKVGMDFIFKGGTSLLLLLSAPKRLSTDIDIVVEPDTDVDSYIEKAGAIFPFTAMEEQKRAGKNNIVKRHFKFSYDSPVRKGPLYILLDVLFEENHYERIVERTIENELLLTEGTNLTVRLPSVDCILGDKLTAFAPYTTGIPLREKKDLEVIKQFYDVSTLIDEFDRFDDVRKTYFAVSQTEIGYRGNGATPEKALEDTIQAAVCIGSRGKTAQDDFPSYLQGTRDIVNHIFDGRFSMEVASPMAAKVIYMAACLLTRVPFDRNADLEGLKTESLTQEDLKTMRAFRKLRTGDYGYLVLADRLLQEYRNSDQKP
ncbi:MAG: nucleotidyl transferase AbiEii/AbiGii toxin family protein [Clostridia bacterium]|nr:nucleotidyl transferase AbiEii/AbiGii toxin family protein [Clostridia bacterium]